MGRLLKYIAEETQGACLLLSSFAMTPDFVNAPPKATHDLL